MNDHPVVPDVAAFQRALNEAHAALSTRIKTLETILDHGERLKQAQNEQLEIQSTASIPKSKQLGGVRLTAAVWNRIDEKKIARTWRTGNRRQRKLFKQSWLANNIQKWQLLRNAQNNQHRRLGSIQRQLKQTNRKLIKRP